jgi:hypothetical protein
LFFLATATAKVPTNVLHEPSFIDFSIVLGFGDLTNEKLGFRGYRYRTFLERLPMLPMQVDHSRSSGNKWVTYVAKTLRATWCSNGTRKLSENMFPSIIVRGFAKNSNNMRPSHRNLPLTVYSIQPCPPAHLQRLTNGSGTKAGPHKLPSALRRKLVLYVNRS